MRWALAVAIIFTMTACSRVSRMQPLSYDAAADLAMKSAAAAGHRTDEYLVSGVAQADGWSFIFIRITPSERLGGDDHFLVAVHETGETSFLSGL